MPNWVIEFLYVFSLSKRTHWALTFGVVIYFGVLVLGNYAVNGLEFTGHLKPLEDVIRDKILYRYDKLALVALISFLVLAVKNFIKDWKRLL
ncbi:hypothetical protein [Alteromonas macleodii]|jgi:hypothetical protein|uniref:hypothetical protein n=1 Tax=Alteromonas macleodii TaxID=28108 RepID=UPI003140C231|tara:strand:+ start:5878 stop:6153 length:276 start_codon:yes stop_codon:yes gene_type:complete